ncbi:MAG: hypothetical protein LBP34_03225 [Flavobacteriaceae bacterium]|jgi:hypothetical protein|nr:hypothetical protein [Flavobacteriaceae bacterium]
MKMKFISLFFVVGLFSAYSQITVTGGAKVFIGKETLVYSSNDVTVTNHADNKVTNRGNIRIASGTLKLDDKNKPEKFILDYTETPVTGQNPIIDYGQLIINESKAVDGKITVRKKLRSANDDYAYFGTPFNGFTHTDFEDAVGAKELEFVCGLFAVNNNCKGSAKWNLHPIFVWNNDRFRSDPFQENSVFIPGKYHVIRKNQVKDKTDNTKAVDFTRIFSFTGTPYVAGIPPIGTSINAITFPKRVKDGYEIGINHPKKGKNEYGIYYYTYLNDPFASALQTTYDQNTDNETLNTARFADGLLYLTNPYTSNIDISKLVDYDKVIGVGSEGRISQKATAKSRTVQLFFATTSPGSGAIGDIVKYIPPMTNFFIKVKGTYDNFEVANLDLFGSSNIQTFTRSSLIDEFGSGGSTVAQKPAGAKAAKSVNTEPDRYQVNLKLNSGDVLYGNTYVAAGPDLPTGTANEAEARNNDNIIEATSIYTIHEAQTGGIAPGYEDSKLYINVINTDAAKVAVPVGVNVIEEDKGKEFVFTSDLRFNQVPLSESNFDNPNAKFYFHDKKANKVKEIDTDFSYAVTLNESTNDRFEIFWSESTMGNEEDIQALKGLTTIYKSGNEYKVRFDKSWKKAEVTVFSILGQLISSQKSIDAQQDYLLPVHNSSSLYVVVIVNELTGEKITKKIVK